MIYRNMSRIHTHPELIYNTVDDTSYYFQGPVGDILLHTNCVDIYLWMDRHCEELV